MVPAEGQHIEQQITAAHDEAQASHRQAEEDRGHGAQDGQQEHQIDGGKAQEGQHHAQEIAGIAVLLPALEAHFGAQLARQALGIAQGRGHFILAAAVGGAVGEVPLIIGDDVVDVGMMQARQPVAQLRHEMRAVHDDASPRILRTAASKAIHSAT